MSSSESQKDICFTDHEEVDMDIIDSDNDSDSYIIINPSVSNDDNHDNISNEGIIETATKKSLSSSNLDISSLIDAFISQILEKIESPEPIKVQILKYEILSLILQHLK